MEYYSAIKIIIMKTMNNKEQCSHYDIKSKKADLKHNVHYDGVCLKIRMWVERKCAQQYSYVSLMDLWMIYFLFSKLGLINDTF